MPNYVYAIIGISIIFLCTTIGSLFVFFFRKQEISDKLNRIFVGFAAGVMFSASFFSLIKPAIESEANYIILPVSPVADLHAPSMHTTICQFG